MRCKNSACGKITKIDLEHETRAGGVKFSDTTVCREIEKTDSDAKSIAGYRSTHNTGIGIFLVNKKLNQWNLNLFVLPCPGWGVRGGILLKIKKFLTFGSILIGKLPYSARLLYEVKNES